MHLKVFNQRYSWEDMGGRAAKSAQDSTAIELSSDYSQKAQWPSLVPEFPDSRMKLSRIYLETAQINGQKTT